jgi:hypothetical protein
MRAQPRRGVMSSMAAGVVILAIATPLAQSRDDRAEAARRESLTLLQQWLGPPPSPLTVSPIGRTAFPASPAAMDVEAAAAFAVARQWWPAQSSTLLDGAARYFESRIVARMFDASYGKAGAGVDTVRLFGDAATITFPQLRFDSPTAGLHRHDLPRGWARAAHAFASLERLVGEPRLLGALRSAVEQRPTSDAEFVRVLNDSLAQDVSWLFAAADSTALVSYAISNVITEPCAPEPCHRIRVDVSHAGSAAFHGVVARIDFADGQAASSVWDGRAPVRTFVFEGPSNPVRISIDPDARNLLDDNLLDQTKQPGGTTNVAVSKWIARWMVWLQDAMLAYSAIV